MKSQVVLKNKEAQGRPVLMDNGKGDIFMVIGSEEGHLKSVCLTGSSIGSEFTNHPLGLSKFEGEVILSN